jgi:hypothetical protein
MPLLLIIYQTDFKFKKKEIMKKLLFILLTTFLSSGIYSQGNNFQFSQVLNYSYDESSPPAHNMVSQGTLTVPANKVWKITSASSYGRRAQDGYTNYANGGLYIDNIEINPSAQNNSSNVPYWLSSGTYTVYLITPESNYHIYGTLSILEFNIVQ